MKYSEYERAFSAARLNKYLTACGGNTAKAIILYRHNVKLCQKFYGMLNVFEVILRNAINEHYKAYFNDSDWIRSQLASGGMLSQHPQKAIVDKTITDLIAAGRYTNDRVVSSVTFGFWTYLFTKKPFRLGGQSLLRIFPAKAIGLGQRAIYNELMAVKNFRNRIAHHEPICFDSSGCKSTGLAKGQYDIIVRYVSYLGYPEDHLYFGLDVLPDSVLERIDRL
ncbi:MAG: Abi family protein [Bacteroidales bacterium]|nr:Abi family protein [Candidatus Cacconaster merdequi]